MKDNNITICYICVRKKTKSRNSKGRPNKVDKIFTGVTGSGRGWGAAAAARPSGASAMADVQAGGFWSFGRSQSLEHGLSGPTAGWFCLS